MISVWPALPPDALVGRQARGLPFPLGEPRCVLFSRARHGLFQGLRALGIRPGDEVLAPAYHHGSEIQALESAGARPTFYAGTDDLAPDEEELERLLTPRTRALHLTHYLGFPQDGGRWRRWCDSRDLLLIEDAAPAWLSTSLGRPVGSMGDLAVFSVYKTVGVPDGGATVCAAAVDRPRGRPPLGIRPTIRRQGAWFSRRMGRVWARAARARPAQGFDPSRGFALGEVGTPPSRATSYLLPRLCEPGIRTVRQRNYRYLLGALETRVRPPFNALPDGASPWIFPIEASDKEGLLRHLADRGIVGMDLWSVPHPSLPVRDFPATAERRARTLALPVHQALTERDLRRMVDVVDDWHRASG
jgi:dTDP-4-amino-4,6-dideoxygalactose transaminase